MFIVISLLLLALECEARLPCILAPLLSESSANNIRLCELTLNEEFTVNILPTTPKIEFETVVKFIASSSNVTGGVCSEVIGVVGDLDLKTASIIHTLASRTNVNITLVSAVAPSTFIPTTKLSFPNLFHLNPLTHYVEALAAFLDHLNWTRIGMISDDTPYYEFAAELTQQRLLENPKRQIIPFVRISERDNKTRAIQTFKEYETDVVVISTSGDVACSLVQVAKKVGFTWPEYAWIIIDVSLNLSLEMCQEGVILVRDKNTLKDFRDRNVSCSYIDMEEHIYSNSIIHSIVAVSEIISATVIYYAQKNILRDGRRLNNITITQNCSSKFIKELAVYNTESQLFSVLSSTFTESDKPRGTTLIIQFSDHNIALHISIVVVAFILFFCFITVILIFYIYFRKEPEIKATSVTVSLFMFLACYSLILYLPIKMVSIIEANDFVCRLQQWLIGLVLSFPLVLATLFAKILRIYFLFCDPLSYKKRFFSNKALIFYILLLISPNFLIMLIQSSFDPNRAIEVESVHKKFIIKDSICTSTHIILWHILLITYCIILTIAVICIALKTSKIRYKHFSDTKATNAFAYLSIFIATSALIFYWLILLYYPGQLAVIIASSLSYFGHSTVALLCQILLFVPKVYPPLKRRLNSL